MRSPSGGVDDLEINKFITQALQSLKPQSFKERRTYKILKPESRKEY